MRKAWPFYGYEYPTWTADVILRFCYWCGYNITFPRSEADTVTILFLPYSIWPLKFFRVLFFSFNRERGPNVVVWHFSSQIWLRKIRKTLRRTSTSTIMGEQYNSPLINRTFYLTKLALFWCRGAFLTCNYGRHGQKTTIVLLFFLRGRYKWWHVLIFLQIISK